MMSDRRINGTNQAQAMILFALCLPVLIGICGLALDGGNLYFQRRNLQSIADAAALVGAQVANFDPSNPEILPAGVIQARANADENALNTGGNLTFREAYVPPISGPHAGDSQYIEVVVRRQVSHSFMSLFGVGTTEIEARAVALCYKPGYGNPAVLALDKNSSGQPNYDNRAILFSGGGGRATDPDSTDGVRILGDLMSFGGIDSRGNANHFLINQGSVYYTSGNAPNMTIPNGGTFDVDTQTSASYLPVSDPIADGIAAGTVRLPTASGNGCVTYEGNLVPNSNPLQSPGNVTQCPGNGDVNATSNLSNYSGTVTRVVFQPGVYRRVSVTGVRAVFRPGAYRFSQGLELGAGSDSTDEGLGVFFQVEGVLRTYTSGNAAFSATGNARYTFTAWNNHTSWPADPLSCSNLTHTNVPPCNSHLNIVFYAPSGSIGVGGTGDRFTNGSIYAPNGEVWVNGNGTSDPNGYVVNGQVIANTVTFSGNGPAVNYRPGGNAGTFGPLLVNTPNQGG